MKSPRVVIALLSVVAVSLDVIAVVMVLQIRKGDDAPTSFSNGTFLVGTDVASGEYVTEGPTGGEPACTIFTSKKPDDLDTIVGIYTATGETRFRVTTGLYVTSEGCGTWTKVG